MKLIIEIPDNYDLSKIQIPKGHSDLIDRNELLRQPIDTANYPSNYVRLAKAIIEADKAESEDENYDG